MQTFKLIEKQNVNSERPAVKIQAKNLTGAKIKATNCQCFYNTILELQDLAGNTLAVKEKSGSWIEQKYFN